MCLSRVLAVCSHLPAMKDIYKDEELDIPSDVTLVIKARTITCEGPRGKLEKVRGSREEFKLAGGINYWVHLQHVKHINMDIRVVKSAKGSKVVFAVWHGNRKHVACLRTVKSLIANMITGVTKGFLYKVRIPPRISSADG